MSEQAEKELAIRLARHVARVAKQYESECRKGECMWKLGMFEPREPRNGFKK